MYLHILYCVMCMPKIMNTVNSLANTAHDNFGSNDDNKSGNIGYNLLWLHSWLPCELAEWAILKVKLDTTTHGYTAADLH